MNEIEQRIQNAEKELAKAKALLKNTPHIILVPDNIRLETCCGGDNLGIAFNDNKQVLKYHGVRDIWVVISTCPNDFIKCKLTPINEVELKIGYTYYHTDEKNPDFSKRWWYCKYLGNDEYAYPHLDAGININNLSWEHWYAVEKII